MDELGVVTASFADCTPRSSFNVARDQSAPRGPASLCCLPTPPPPPRPPHPTPTCTVRHHAPCLSLPPPPPPHTHTHTLQRRAPASLLVPPPPTPPHPVQCSTVHVPLSTVPPPPPPPRHSAAPCTCLSLDDLHLHTLSSRPRHLGWAALKMALSGAKGGKGGRRGWCWGGGVNGELDYSCHRD